MRISICYTILAQSNIREIVGKCVASLNARLADRQITVSLSPEVVDLIVKEGFSPEYGARELERCFERLVCQELADLLVRSPNMSGRLLLTLLNSQIFFEMMEEHK